ncbi:hypothetical protein AAFF_G00355780 [Aldrovandia affinis]|uniref:Uncharacterized protein n=1 Tax=Aldrovandia affinis TaxID=143900 RepID=A0AAD7R5T2_9TELE|nr:hypothetical protein AAFF_G00355780 [Aldrovandia affinis]
MRRYAADISSLAEEFQQRFRDFAAIEQEITLFPLLSPWTLMTLQTTCSWSSLSCSVAPSVQSAPTAPLLSTFYQLDKGRFQEIRTFAKKMLSLFGSTYLCEKTFSL